MNLVMYTILTMSLYHVIKNKKKMIQRIYFQSADPDFIEELDELKNRVVLELGDVIKMVDQTIGYADLELDSDLKFAPTDPLKFFISECDDFCLITFWSYPKEDNSNSTDIKTDASIKESLYEN